jgi:AraC family transcriptional regulator
MNSSLMRAIEPRALPGRVADGIPTKAWNTTQHREHDAANSSIPPSTLNGSYDRVHFRPWSLAKRQTAAWRGLSGEVVRIIRQEPFEIEHSGPSHLLIAYEHAARHRGESIIDGLPRSTLRDFSHKLTFVPAGRSFREWQDPRVLMHATFLQIDPHGALMGAEHEFTATEFTPRLHFDSPVLWQTALKLKALIEADPSPSRLYAEALGVVLAHELLRLNSGTTAVDPPTRGGLATWQQRLISEYLEENLAEQISLAKLAELAQLSPYHFSRAFKQSFGMPPHRYHTSRRIERAKTLLAKPNLSVTDIAIQVGFSETSSFTAAFRKLSGRTPTGYRRSLV